MHSFHQSRGRIFFEVVCALTISASCAGAWLQTGATAFLPAAFAAALYGLWHLTDMGGRKPAVAVDQGDPALAAESQGARNEYLETVTPEPASAAEPKPAARPKRTRKKQSVAKAPAVAVVEPVEVVAAVPQLEESEEEHSAPIAQLFEPQPLVRQPRPVFGRKAG